MYPSLFSLVNLGMYLAGKGYSSSLYPNSNAPGMVLGSERWKYATVPLTASEDIAKSIRLIFVSYRELWLYAMHKDGMEMTHSTVICPVVGGVAYANCIALQRRWNS